MWYVLQVKTGCEESIRDKLIELGYHAIVPIANRLIRSKGSWNNKKTIIFTGYVFVNLDYDAENYYRITSMDNVVKFLGDKNDPSTLTYIEAEWICILGDNGILEPTLVEVENKELKVLKGVLQNFKSRIKSYDIRQKRAVFEITVCNEIKEITLSIDVINTEEQESDEE